MFKILIPALVCCFLAATPALAEELPTAPPPVKIVASFSILGDMVKQVGGEHVSVETLVGAGQDAHSFDPSPEAVKTIAQADIIAINGLKFEPWIGRLIKASGTKAKLLVASAGVKPLLLDHGHHEEHEASHANTEIHPDPHAWQDLRNGALYVRSIANALAAAQPENKEYFITRAKAYQQELLALDEQTRRAFEAIAPDKRKIITGHDALSYFAAAYGLTILSPTSINTEAQPTAQNIAALIDQIKQENIKALFIENMHDPRQMETIARDTGARLGGTLYTDALSPADGEAPTYLEMMKVNGERIVGGLK